MSERVDYQILRGISKDKGFMDSLFGGFFDGLLDPFGVDKEDRKADEEIDKRDDVQVDRFNFGSKYPLEEKVLTGFILDDSVVIEFPSTFILLSLANVTFTT